MTIVEQSVEFEYRGGKLETNCLSYGTDWAGRTSLWPPRFSDISILGYFFWGYVKEKMFRPTVGRMVELSVQINSAVASVTPQPLEVTCREIECHFDILQAANGTHIEKRCT